uniref:Putative secreted protein n=1 Tax=Xenopsylla cheopis TaxID=163159 RepID=A0A6M2DX70_XENCH
MTKLIVILLCSLISKGFTIDSSQKNVETQNGVRNDDQVNNKFEIGKPYEIISHNLNKNSLAHIIWNNFDDFKEKLLTHPRFSRSIHTENHNDIESEDHGVNKNDTLVEKKKRHHKSKNNVDKIGRNKHNKSQHNNIDETSKKIKTNKHKTVRKRFNDKNHINKENKFATKNVQQQQTQQRKRKHRNIADKNKNLKNLEIVKIPKSKSNSIKVDDRAEFLETNKKVNDYKVLSPFLFSSFWDTDCPEGQKKDAAGKCRIVW